MPLSTAPKVDASPLRAGVIGLGPMGALHLAVTSAMGTRELAVVETDDRILRFAPRLLGHVRFFSDHHSMINDFRPEVVYVCTPPHTHPSIVEDVLKAASLRGIFVEKPLATNSPDARRLVRAIEQRHLPGVVGFQRRFAGPFSEAKRLLDTGVLGKPKFFRAHAFTLSDFQALSRWRGAAESGGATLEWGIHIIDLVLWYFGMPSKVDAARTRLISRDVEDYARCELSYGSGLVGTIEIGWAMRDYATSQVLVDIHGTRATLSASEDRLVLYGGDGHKDTPTGSGRVWHSSQLTPKVPFLLGQPTNVLEEMYFRDCLASGSVPLNSFNDSLQNLQVVDRIRGAPLG